MNDDPAPVTSRAWFGVIIGVSIACLILYGLSVPLGDKAWLWAWAGVTGGWAGGLLGEGVGAVLFLAKRNNA